jgi:hypothetical protein
MNRSISKFASFVVIVTAIYSNAVGGAVTREPLFEQGRIAVGCNYWASHAGVYMWRNWDAAQVEKDLDLLAAHDMTILRVFPLWPDFQPLTAEYGACGTFQGYSQNGGPLKNYAAVDDEMINRFRFLCDAAEKRGMKLVVGLITGWMSGRLFAPPALEAKNVLTDTDAIAWQCRFVRYIVNSLKDHGAIAAWDLGNECNCMGEADASRLWMWMHAVSSEIRMNDPSRPVVSGMHSVGTARSAKTNMRQQGELVDWLTTHPYPLWTPHCNLEPFDTLRNACHPACETTLYANLSGRPAFVEEAGSMGPGIVSEERAAAAMRTQMFSCWAAGIPAFVWWCAFDQGHLDFAPYDWTAIERELGLFKADGTPKPTAKAMKDFAAFVKTLPFAALAPRRIDACVLVSEKEDFWRQALGAWMLSRQAGFDICYASAEGEWPESDFYILPSGGASYATYSRRAWKKLVARARGGSTVLITLGNGAVLSDLEAVAGIRTQAHFKHNSTRRIESDRGAFDLYDSVVRKITPVGADVLVKDADGNPVMTATKAGAGKILFVNGALEANAPIAGWPLYALAADEAGVKRLVRSDNPSVGFTEHRADGVTYVLAVNYSPIAAQCRIETEGRILRVFGNGTYNDGILSLGANDGVVLEVLSEKRYNSR